jgi:hypothetical protein
MAGGLAQLDFHQVQADGAGEEGDATDNHVGTPDTLKTSLMRLSVRPCELLA